ncbi:MAG: hypothetical protein ACRDNS_13525, partial [Trebonia sp.]
MSIAERFAPPVKSVPCKVRMILDALSPEDRAILDAVLDSDRPSHGGVWSDKAIMERLQAEEFPL